MFRRLFLAATIAAFLAITLTPNLSFAQAVYGSILGTVTDPQGAAVPNAKVIVTNQRKGTTDTTTTNQDGNYSVTHLIPDTYTVHVEAQGFKAAEQKNVVVSVDNGSRVDMQVQVGGATETVEVTGEAPQLKTDRADVAITFDTKMVESLPILNRNFQSLELASPGTQRLVGWNHAATENPQASQQIFVNGQHFSGTAYELDGTDNQDPILGIIVVNPNIDAVTETKFNLQNYDAEFGKAVAGIMTVQTKSGSNEFHGTGFYFRRTDATQARNPFTQYSKNPLTGRFLPSARWQQFGGTFGGPIIKDKLFFFGDYQGTRQTVGVTNQLTIPTAQVLTTCNPATNNNGGYCDLSQYVPFMGNGTPGDPTTFIYDPNTGDPVTGAGRTAFCGPAGCGTQPNWIPLSRIPTQVLNILSLFPQPTNSSVTNNFVASGSGPYNQNSFDTRIDYTASPTLNFFGRYSLDYFNLSGGPSLGPALGGVGFGLGGLAGSAVTHNYSLATGFTKTLSSSLLTDFRFGWFKYNPQTHKYDEGKTPMTDFGIQNMNLGDTTTSGLAAFYMDSGVMSSFGEALNIGRCNCPLTESEQQIQFVNNWTKMKGNHQFKFGADVRYAMNLRIPSDSNRTGQLHFNSAGTSDAGTGGLDLATFLLGDVTFMDRYVNAPGTLGAAERQKRLFFYGQDTYRATTKLTINYGLRWELYTPEAVNGKGRGGFANITEGVIRVAGYGPYGMNGNVANNWKAFAPRLGVAYQLTPKTVVRMGYGRSYDIGVFGSNFGHTVTQNLPVLVNQNVNASSSPFVGNTSARNDVIPAFTLGPDIINGYTFPGGPPLFQFPAIPSNGQLPLQGPLGNVQPKVRPVKQVLPTVDAWNVTVQRQLTNTLSVEAAYVGSKGTHVFAGLGPSYNVNQVWVGPGTSVDGSFVANTPQSARRPLAPGGVPRFTYPSYPDPNDPALPLTCCFNDVGYLGNDASNNYNSLQVRVDKRFTRGLQFQANYTLARARNYMDDYYVDNPRIAYGPDEMTRTHVFLANVVYELPFGKGKTFASNAGRALDAIIGGWQLSSATNWSSGLPWTPSYGECGQDKDAGPCRPNKGSGDFKLGAGSLQHPSSGQPFIQYFTPVPNGLAITGQPTGTDFCTVSRPSMTGFSRPACGTIGNLGRDTFRGPRHFTDDMSLAKNFKATERVSVQFRMDAYNVFNHPVLGFSSQDYGATGGTCVDCGGNNGEIRNIEDGTSMRQLQFGLKLIF